MKCDPQTHRFAHFLDGIPATAGVDIAVSNERILLLDTEPLQSLALLDRCIRMDAPLPAQCTSYEQAVTLRSYQIAMFAMSVCDVVLVVQDWAVDAAFLRFLWTAEQLLAVTVPPSSPATTSRAPEAATTVSPHVGM